VRIAILGWGSLIWDPRQLQITGDWKSDGPTLPIEFGRISGDGRLTLVIDRDHGIPMQVAWIESSLSEGHQTIEDLAKREGCPIHGIGFVDRIAGTGFGRYTELVEAVCKWAAEHQLDAAAWTDLGPNFTEKTGVAFSSGAALKYLTDLPTAQRTLALEYVKNTPQFVQTPVRRAVAEGLTGT
jgi:hypothetical protein